MLRYIQCQAGVFLASYFRRISCPDARIKLVVNDFSPSVHAFPVELDAESFVCGLSLRMNRNSGSGARHAGGGLAVEVLAEGLEDDAIDMMVDTKPLLM